MRARDILNRDFFVQTSVLVPILKDSNGVENFVFEIRADQIRQGGEICFPGGLFDPLLDDNFELTAIRETSEELGLTRDKIKVDRYLGCVVTAYGVLVESFIGRIEVMDLNEIEYNKAEVSKLFSLPISFFKQNKPEEYELSSYIQPYAIDESGIREEIFPAKSLGLPKKYWERWESGKHKTYAYRTEYGTIWGLTALLALLTSRIKLKVEFSEEAIKFRSPLKFKEKGYN